MNDQVVGTCSRCGGLVIVPGLWSGTQPAPARCQKCRAVADHPTMPVIKTRSETADETAERIFSLARGRAQTSAAVPGPIPDPARKT